MKPELRFEERIMAVSDLGEENKVPDLTGSLVLQNDLNFHLGEDDEIYEGYGKRRTSYPYRQYNTYDRKLEERIVKTAVLENNFIRAVFLPELGGRLWELWDKQSGRNLLYTNDVIRYSNLAVRNAWFSGGVEWNIGIIGHTPFTTEQIYTAALQDDERNPVLRMYEYERLRGIEYQMDFWLAEREDFLNCRMRIVNSGKETVPMYWWSNMAVPEYQNGRIVVPAEKAFTSRGQEVFKKDIPVVDGVDITKYEQIPSQVDYFFDIPENSPKFIANLDAGGYGLFHLSTNRLKSRKLFSWGNKEGSASWQNFLTRDAGRYVEIQAGLGKTQYGCIPMAPHTAWEWMEQYGAIQIDRKLKEGLYKGLCASMEAAAGRAAKERRIEEVLKQRKKTALKKGELVLAGSGYGKLKEVIRRRAGEPGLSAHLEYVSREEQEAWAGFLETGIFMENSENTAPADFVCDEAVYWKLRETIEGLNRDNWYAHYHLAVMELDRGNQKDAELEFLEALRMSENPWSCHGMAALLLLKGEKKDSISYIKKGLSLRKEDIGYVKEGFKLLLAAEGFEELKECYKELSEVIRKESRVSFDYMMALARTGEEEKAGDLLKPDFVLEDLREGEDGVSDLWNLLYQGEDRGLPLEWNFSSL